MLEKMYRDCCRKKRELGVDRNYRKSSGKGGAI
jgi:hypothetical protein